jgi:hypothetical protein
MAQLNKIKSFKSFSDVMAQDKAVKIAEENATKRGELTAKIAALLDEMNITSFDDLEEDVKREFITKAFGSVSEEEAGIEAEELEDETKVVDSDVEQPEDVEKELDLEGEGDAEGDEIAEGNAFIFAAAKAKAAGEKEFEFNGKTYKVTLKKDTGLRESVLIITEGTRGQFGKIYKTGEIASVYTHYDSYPENMLPIIKKAYKKGTDVDAVISKGDNSGLEADINKMNFYGDVNSMKPMKGSVKNLKKYINDADSNGAEYAYLFDERDGKWYMIELYGDRDLKPAFESVQVEEGNAFGDAVRKAKEAGEKEFEFEGETYKVEEDLESVLCEATVEMDAMDPDDKDFLKFLKKHKVTIIDKKMDGPGGGNPVITMQGKRKDLEAVLADEELGWADPDLAEYIEESILIEAAVEESVVTEVNEAEIKSDDEFKEYAFSVLQKAFGSDFDEAKAQEVVDGILGKVDGDYGAAVGMLTSSLGESLEVNESKEEDEAYSIMQDLLDERDPFELEMMEPEEAEEVVSSYGHKGSKAKKIAQYLYNMASTGAFESVTNESVEVAEKKADGTISDDEDEKREELLGEVEQVMDTLLKRIKEVSFEIGGNFRAPGIQHDAKKVIDSMVKKFK